MIDKVDVRIPEFALPGPVLQGPFEQLKRHPIPLFRPSRFFKYVCDLREPFGIDAVVHLWLRQGRPTHKVEIIDAGEKTIFEIADIITLLFEVDPWSLQLMRIDLAADLQDIPVSWFKDRAYVNRKQFSSRIDKSFEKEVQFVGMGTAVAQILYAGKRPCLMRIYNKLAEWLMQLRRIEFQCRRFNKRMADMDMSEEQRFYGQLLPPTFEEFCRARGYQFKSGNILTRIERQIGGKRFPRELNTLGDLRYAHEFEPFGEMEIIGTAPVLNFDSPPAGMPVRNWLALIGFEAMIRQLGSAQLARSVVLKHGNGNGRRILESLVRSSPTPRQPLTMEEIQDSYKRSTFRQTSNSSQAAVHLSPTYEQTK